MIWDAHSGSGSRIRILICTPSGSWIQESKRHRIRIRNTEVSKSEIFFILWRKDCLNHHWKKITCNKSWPNLLRTFLKQICIQQLKLSPKFDNQIKAPLRPRQRFRSKSTFFYISKHTVVIVSWLPAPPSRPASPWCCQLLLSSSPPPPPPWSGPAPPPPPQTPRSPPLSSPQPSTGSPSEKRWWTLR